ncbi:MAG: NAD(P)/FAD-dependent oxidoreductase [Mahellales bacterium]|jgi:predicted Rossmann fold flavoprotein
MKKVLIMGGGAAGIMAAVSAANQGKRVFLFERNEKLGKKIYLTGKGRCNITNNIDMEHFFDFIPRNPKFMYSALNALSNAQLINFFEKNGLKLKVERGNRVFPASNKSSDVIKFFNNYLLDKNVKIHLNTRIKDLIVENNMVKGIKTDKDIILGDAVIIATGGLSYPSTGSTGDGYTMAKKYGHSIVKTEPALVPIETKESFVGQLKGLTLKNIELSAHRDSKVIYRQLGELLFTHFGISGPLVLTLSSIATTHQLKNALLLLDLKPGLTHEQLDKRLQRDLAKNINKQIGNALFDLLPKRIIPIILQRAGIMENIKVNQISRSQRKNIVENIKGLSLTFLRKRPIEEAVITRGGISIKDIKSSTMESKIITNLYFAGEIIDVDGLTGGFNLQIAFSTGYLAGLHC